ncbi:SDR family oxidoreductase [Alphaproteobacteria bacterium]|nr:SDR family oxidoreductase [Alphaproteobacteria bacterium]
MISKDKVVCITGAGNGIGRAIAIEMNKCGFNVACADIDFEAAQKTVSLLNCDISKSIPIRIDVRNLDEIDSMIQTIVNSFGRLDVMVNNAGVTRVSNLEDLTEEDWDWIHSINAKGTFFCLQAAAKQMIKQNFGGRIINMSSIGAKGFLDVSNAIYAASKGAVLSLTKTAAQELGRYQITVNSICPGVTLTDILDKIITTRSQEQNKSKETILKHYLRDSPLGNPNEPKDIACMVSFLSSEGAKNISGQSFNIDGGTIPS